MRLRSPSYRDNTKKYIIAIVIIAVITIFIFAGTEATGMVVGSGGEWRCNAVNCTRYVAGEEWANSNCFLQDGQNVCSVQVNGQNTLLPLEQLDISQISQCIEYNCVEETFVRKVNYPYDIQ